MSNLLAAIRARDLEITCVRTEVIATLADSPTRFESVELRISADTPDRGLLHRLVEIADRGCIMMNTLRGKLDVRVKVGVLVWPRLVLSYNYQAFTERHRSNYADTRCRRELTLALWRWNPGACACHRV
jgi:hypothetical protein